MYVADILGHSSGGTTKFYTVMLKQCFDLYNDSVAMQGRCLCKQAVIVSPKFLAYLPYF
jgi:hypothetical protein